MEKLQEMVDAPFGAQAERVPQRPSEAFNESERTFSEPPGTIETPSLVFEIVRHRGHWRTLYHKKHSTPFSDQAAAILAAKRLARKKRAMGHPVEVRLVRTDGQVVPQAVDDEQSE